MGACFLGIITCTVLLGVNSYGQSTDSAERSVPSVPTQTISASRPEDDSGRVGIGVKASSLGAGLEVAARLTHWTNVRAGFNAFSYSRALYKDGVSYNGQLSFKNVEAHYDFLPFAGSFHVGPGLLVYIGDPIAANSAVPGGQRFTLDSTRYFSDSAVPVTGNVKINFNHVAPLLTFGWGNLVPRNLWKHFSIPFEVGLAFQGPPKATLNLSGNVCSSPGVDCRNVIDPGVQAALQSERIQINHRMSFLKAYPIVSVGFGYKF